MKIMLTAFNSPIAVTFYPVFVMYVLLYYSTKPYAFKQRNNSGFKEKDRSRSKNNNMKAENVVPC